MRASFPFIAAFLVAIPSAFSAPAAKPMTICLTESTGAVIARPKCRKGEVVFNARSLVSTLSGPQGPQGPQGVPGPQGPVGGSLDYGSCYKKSVSKRTTFLGVGLLSAECNNTESELMIADSLSSDTGLSYINEKKLIFDSTGKVPVGAEFTTLRNDLVNYTIEVTIVCCVR
jgi:hypothetical protein